MDDDGKAYIAFTHETTHSQSVQELDPSLLGPLAGGRSSRIGHAGNEGLVFFKRRNRYYLGFGGLSCFGRQGSNVAIWSSEHPLGPYNASGDIMPSAAWSAQSDAVFRPACGHSSQRFSVLLLLPTAVHRPIKQGRGMRFPSTPPIRCSISCSGGSSSSIRQWSGLVQG